MKPAARLESLPYSRDSGALASRLADRPWFVFLDSCRQAGTRGRYDILACDPQAVLITRGGHTTIQRGDEVESSRRDPFHLVDEALAELGPAEAGELPFAGGAIGFFAYDLGRRLEQLPALANRDLDTPDMVVGLYAHAVVVDHNTQACWLVSHPSAREEPAFLRRACRVQEPLTPAAFGTRFEVTSQVRPEMDFATYAAAWQRIKRYLSDGDVYQVNLTQRFSAEVRGDAWDAYQRLRHVNPAPFSAYLKLPNGAILSSSPERFVRVQGDEVETRPIKGTRRRSDDPAEDARLAEELAASSKDRAENVMIVDLLRNDLGKICAVGSVRVPRLFAIETYARVHHLVSIVCGKLAFGVSAALVLRACFPGGSITGAPKIRAMEIIEELEPNRRGVYCGAIGYLSCDGGMDTNIAIRTLVQDGTRLYCWAGGGIVMDSELEAEYQE
ncbi:MAG: aminodeoxychorismate synthase component I, partial [Gammaproteobacteria bacterium]|nr:aminodeoxychorismate synthase component I [Gammaproteobacteria bacterium]